MSNYPPPSPPSPPLLKSISWCTHGIIWYRISPLSWMNTLCVGQFIFPRARLISFLNLQSLYHLLPRPAFGHGRTCTWYRYRYSYEISSDFLLFSFNSLTSCATILGGSCSNLQGMFMNVKTEFQFFLYLKKLTCFFNGLKRPYGNVRYRPLSLYCACRVCEKAGRGIESDYRCRTNA